MKKQNKEKIRHLLKLPLLKGETVKYVVCLNILVLVYKKLSRVSFGPLTLKGLGAGEGRVLSPHEVKSLRHLAENGQQQR